MQWIKTMTGALLNLEPVTTIFYDRKPGSGWTYPYHFLVLFNKGNEKYEDVIQEFETESGAHQYMLHLQDRLKASNSGVINLDMPIVDDKEDCSLAEAYDKYRKQKNIEEDTCL